MTSTIQTTSKINALLTKNYNAEKGYKKAAEIVNNNKLKQFFETEAQKRYDFGHQLKSEIKNFGDTPEKGTSLKGDAHRAWMDVKSVFTSSDASAILEEVKRGEKATISEYNEVINDISIPPSTKTILTKQKASIENALQGVKNFEVMIS